MKRLLRCLFVAIALTAPSLTEAIPVMIREGAVEVLEAGIIGPDVRRTAGESDELTGLLEYLSRLGVQVIALTGRPGSALGRAADAEATTTDYTAGTIRWVASGSSGTLTYAIPIRGC